jgi:hypothetical protein
MTIDITNDIIIKYIKGHYDQHGFYPKKVLVCDSLYEKIPSQDLTKIKQTFGTIVYNEEKN